MNSKTDPLIEVIGTANYEIVASEYSVSISVEEASGLKRLEKQSEERERERRETILSVLSVLKKHDFPDKQIMFDAIDDQLRWLGGKNWKQQDIRSSQITCRHSDRSIISQIPFWIEAEAVHKAAIKYNTLPPKFDPDPALEAKAFAQAVTNARLIASAIAEAGGVNLGPMRSTQDLRLAGRETHSYGSGIYASGGGAAAAMAAPAASFTDEIESRSFDESTKTYSVRVRVAFAVN
jgi:uncharacterized protein YggE